MALFPTFINIENKNVIIFGGGMHAFEKAEKLHLFNPRITVISPSFISEFDNINYVNKKCRSFRLSDLIFNKPVLVISAMENDLDDEIISHLCKKLRIPVNVVDKPKMCSFIFPSLVVSDNLSVGISTNGLSPAVGMEIKNKINESIPSNIDSILISMYDIRNKLKTKIISPAIRKYVIKKLANYAVGNDFVPTEDTVQSIIFEISKESDK